MNIIVPGFGENIKNCGNIETQDARLVSGFEDETKNINI